MYGILSCMCCIIFLGGVAINTWPETAFISWLNQYVQLLGLQICKPKSWVQIALQFKYSQKSIFLAEMRRSSFDVFFIRSFRIDSFSSVRSFCSSRIRETAIPVLEPSSLFCFVAINDVQTIIGGRLHYFQHQSYVFSCSIGKEESFQLGTFSSV